MVLLPSLLLLQSPDHTLLIWPSVHGIAGLRCEGRPFKFVILSHER